MVLTKTEQLQAAIERLGLKEISTTSQSNGYPANVRNAVIGFDNFEQAQEFATELELKLTYFKKRDGWNLWHRSGGLAHGAMLISCNDYGDNYNQFRPGIDEPDFFQQEIGDFIPDFQTFDSLEKFLALKKEIYSAIQAASEGEIVLTHNGIYFETIKEETLYFCHDTKHIAIGCEINWNQIED